VTTLWHLVEHRAKDAPEAPALLFGDARWSNAEFRERAARIASGLRALGIGRGDVVAVQLPNIPEYLATYAAVCALGAVMQTVHMPYRRAELSVLLAHARAKAFVCLSRFKEEQPAAEARSLQKDLPSLREVIALGEESFASLEKANPIEHPEDTKPEDRFLLLYTSGTTDNPKGVPLAYKGFLANARASVPELEVGASDVLLSVAPLTHLYGLFVYHLALHAGAAMSLLPAFTPPELAATIDKHRATGVFAGPVHFKPMLDAGLLDRHDLSSVKFVCLSGSAVPPALAAAVEAKLSAQGKGRTLQLWGMSELQAGSYCRPRDPAEVRHGSAGAATPGTELRIVDDAGKVLPAGSEGRLQVRGISVFAGYLENAGATAEAFTRDGWFETGDTARLTAGGHLQLTGRVKEIINRGGVKYSPIDIEAILDRVAGVARCAVVPYADPVLGERACVFVQPAPGAAAPALEQLTRALEAAGIAKFKWPERVETIAALPLTPTQKIMRGRLRGLLKGDVT
jgi:acyl-CoA synthetase (AMP-forming)/AMP-acid ligase II